MLFAVIETHTVPDDGDELVDSYRQVVGLRIGKTAACELARQKAKELQEKEYPDGGVDSFHTGQPAGQENGDHNLTSVVVYEEYDEDEQEFTTRVADFHVEEVTDLGGIRFDLSAGPLVPPTPAQELFEMGWNDVMGQLRISTGVDSEGKPHSTDDQRRDWARRAHWGEVKMPRSEDEYRQGVREATKQFLRDGQFTFKGTPEIIHAMLVKTEPQVLIHLPEPEEQK